MKKNLTIYDLLEKDKKSWKKNIKYGSYSITRDMKTGNYTVTHSKIRTRKAIGPELVIDMIKQDKIMKYLSEAGMITGGYPDDGSTGPASDDDQPPGNIILGPRSVRRDYFNKLNKYNTIWDVDNKEDFTWDYFDNLGGMEDTKNYHSTLKDMGYLFPKETWYNAWKKMKSVSDKEADKGFKTPPNNQGWRDYRSRLGDEPEWDMGGNITVDLKNKKLDSPSWDEGVKESFNLLDRIDKILIDGCKSKKKKKKLSESKVSDTILKQIKAIDKWALDSYGAKNFVASNDSIQFDVRGSKFRGRVIITYDKSSDTYVVELGQVRNLKWKQKYMMKNIFAQDLVNVLDQQVG